MAKKNKITKMELRERIAYAHEALRSFQDELLELNDQLNTMLADICVDSVNLIDQLDDIWYDRWWVSKRVKRTQELVVEHSHRLSARCDKFLKGDDHE